MTEDRSWLLSEARLPYLTERERRALAGFLERLEAAAGDRVEHVIFFGSKARGDAEPDSDLDVMVVADMSQEDVNVVRGKHSGLEIALGEFLVKPGLVEPELHTVYRELMRGRAFSDYKKPELKLSQAEMLALLPQAERFVGRMERFLQDHGFIPPQESD